MGAIANTTLAQATQHVYGWVSKTDQQAKQHGANELEEAEQMTCLFQDECLGGVTTYTDEFKQRFRISGEPRCKQIVEKLHRTADAKQVAAWKADMATEFGCPKPKSGAVPPSATPSTGGSASGDHVSVVGQLA